MAYEVMSSKLYAPIIGSSIYVWTSILSITLLGLALGYKKGDKVEEQNLVKTLIKSLVISGLYICLMSYAFKFILMPFIGVDIRIISLIAGIILLFIPMYFMGHVSPILVRLLSSNKENNEVGFSSGIIYFLGTLSGIIFAMLSVFLMMEIIGVSLLIFILGTLLVLSTIAVKLKSNQK